MIIRLSKISILIILSIISLTCFTDSALSKNIIMIPLTKDQINSPDISDAYLIQGAGADWVNNILYSAKDGLNAIFGYTHKSFGNTTDFLAIVEGPGHNLIWAKTYGGTHLDRLNQTIITSDGGYLMIGASQSLFFTALKVINPNRPPRPFLVKIDSSGDVQWALTIDREIYDITDIIEIPDHEYIALGTSVNGTGKEAKWGLALLKISNQGEELWSYLYDAGLASFSYNLVKTTDGSLLVSGLIRNENYEDAPGFNSLLLKVDMEGNPIWARKYILDGEQLLQLTSMIVQDFNDTYILTGTSQNNANKEEAMTLKLSGDGKLIWAQAYGYAKPYNYEPAETITGYNQELLIAGQLLENPEQDANRKGAAIIIDQNGQMKTFTVIEDNPKNATQILSAAKLSDGKFRLLGHTSGFQAKYIDMIALTWNPQEKSNKDILSSRFSQHVLQIKQQELHFTMYKISPKFVQIPISDLQLKTIIENKDPGEDK